MCFDINYLFQHLVSICCKNKAILLKNLLIELFPILKVHFLQRFYTLLQLVQNLEFFIQEI